MKKIYILIFVLFGLTGCCNSTYGYNFENIENTLDVEDKYYDDNPITVGLYKDNELVTVDETTLGNFKDIGVYNVYFTQDKYISGYSVKNTFLNYYNKYKNINDYKVGFYVELMAGDKLINQVILDPSSKHKNGPYLYVYLYDDINQLPGAWYSHLEPDDVKDNTVISSIKLFFPHQGVDVTSSIKLTVFTYKNEKDFDSEGMYRGRSKYTIEIKTKAN